MIAPPHWECVGLEGTRYHDGWCKGSVGGCCYPVLLVLVPTCTHPRLKIVLWMQGYHIFPLIMIHFLCKEGLSFSSRIPTRKIIKISLRRKANYLIPLEPFSVGFEDELRRPSPKTTNVEIKCWKRGRSWKTVCSKHQYLQICIVSQRICEREYIFQLWVVCAPKLCHVTLPGAWF